MKIPKDAKKKAQPSWISPMLATLVDEPFSDQEWIFEKKFDGVRCLIFKKGDGVTIYSRNHRNMNATYPELVEPFQKLKSKAFILDGEIVTGKGKLESFSKLQPRMNIRCPERAMGKKIAVSFYAFDLLYYEGYDLRNVPLIERKRLLKAAFSFSKPLYYTSHRKGSGKTYFEEICRQGYEGAIAKKASATYVSKRSRNWLKFKGANSQEFVIAGFTKPQGTRVGFGALLIGYYEKGNLKFAGKVGTGYDTELLKTLGSKLQKIETERCPFAQKSPPLRSAHWVRPSFVCEVGFTEWTRDGKLRHPRFLGLRKDKKARSVRRERGK